MVTTSKSCVVVEKVTENGEPWKREEVNRPLLLFSLFITTSKATTRASHLNLLSYYAIEY
jgi:hypothetical protein